MLSPVVAFNCAARLDFPADVGHQPLTHPAITVLGTNPSPLSRSPEILFITTAARLHIHGAARLGDRPHPPRLRSKPLSTKDSDAPPRLEGHAISFIKFFELGKVTPCGQKKLTHATCGLTCG